MSDPYDRWRPPSRDSQSPFVTREQEERAPSRIWGRREEAL